MLDFVGKAKWCARESCLLLRLFSHGFERDAWKAVEGKSKEEAAKEYVDKLTEVNSNPFLSVEVAVQSLIISS